VRFIEAGRLPALLLALALALGVSAPVRAQTGTIHDGLELARADRAGEPAAVRAFEQLARAYGTPLYVYDRATIVRQFESLDNAFRPRFPKLRIFYATKANTNLAIVALLHRLGAGAEVVSGGEIELALRAGVRGRDVMFTSSSKSPEEIALALRVGATLNVDSLDELEQIEKAAARSRTIGRISFRVNPGVDPHTIHQINTGIEDSKFGLHLTGGIAKSGYKRALALRHVKIAGVHCHIGSQITETEGYELTARKMLAFVKELKDDLGIQLEFVDLGGGLGIPYRDGQSVMTPEDLAKALEPIWKEGVRSLGYEPTLWLEPGRFFVAQSGFVVTRVNTVKTTPLHTFVNVDAGFNTLVRPAMYQAYHRVRIVGRSADVRKVEIAGVVCETGDILASERMLPESKAGDLVVILDAGAYGYAMASEYNSRPLPAEVLVDGNRVTVIRRRGTITDLLRNQVMPR
jgi:diaminopimelate decarboxylase